MKHFTMEELEIAKIEVPKAMRLADRYAVLVDGDRYYPKTPQALRKLLANIVGDDKPRVFLNFDCGVTIDFDKEWNRWSKKNENHQRTT